ncbi:MAG TPA: hypothetical protein DCG19_08680 [Cryomorphaceae bacterium]|nr:hypothetical protein [Owenweeksia sp.]HAD97468.1 hypothetical protein [Cryomorphaceae bacterium]HBF19509.1 hypothetical protein [Cryomorphaceae bacterium]HCQ15938.1 hypothetical protein [Cryomorphaceae bacterium]|tara:strand:+ start:902 stop:1939 length:1038 start_codon:yes stop_codon:yes gene_type:complete
MKTLEKAEADALCTIVLLGYCQSKKKTPTFVYELKSKEDYSKVKSIFNGLGVQITIQEALPKTENAVIIAETSRTAYYGSNKKIISDIENRLNRSLEKLTEDNLFGAYIGGRSTIAAIELIGSSIIQQYRPRYRAVDSDIEDRYSKAIKNTRGVSGILRENYIPQIDKVKIRLELEPFEPEENSGVRPGFQDQYLPGHLFKSIHGMVASMILFAFVDDKNAFNFELAYSRGTTKVASCFPCCAFMTANGVPPSATHLGRGDNWNLPDPNLRNVTYLKKPWVEKINEWYQMGMKVLADKRKTTAWHDMGFSGSDVHEVFLEALTFEGPFTQKVIDTTFEEQKVSGG